MTATERNQNHRARRRAAGLCLRCTEPAVLGSGFCAAHIEMRKNQMQQWYSDLRKQVIVGYDGKCQCFGCNESRIEFLTVDHVNNNGADHRRKVGHKAFGSTFYRWLIVQNFPKEYQLLCYNCNCAKGFYGECPHVAENRLALAMAAAGGE